MAPVTPLLTLFSSGILSLILSTVFLIVCGIFYTSHTMRYLSLILWITIALLTMLNLGFWQLTGVGFNESVPINMFLGLKGTPFMDSYKVIIFGIISILIIIIMIGLYGRVPKRKKNFFLCLISIALQCLFLGGHPLLRDIYSLYAETNEVGPLTFEKSYLIPNLSETNKTNSTSKNIIWIYAESLERTYLDKNIFPDLLPHITELEQKSISFQNIQQSYGTGWTIAGLVATQCGVPLVISGWKEEIMEEFMPGATCMSDILAKNGYKSVFMQGADGDFASNNIFFKNHDVEFYGLKELEDTVQKKDINGWGITDDILLKIALEKYHTLAQDTQPFFLGISTINTHHPYGFSPSAYKDVLYKNGDNSILNAVHVSDKIISEFIYTIMLDNMLENKGRETIIILSSDHLAMPNTASEMLDSSPKKRNLLMYFLPNYWEQQTNLDLNRPATMMDAGVTAMDLAGIDISALGFGRSLIRSEKTLNERLGDQLSRSLKTWTKELRVILWGTQ